LLVVTFSLVRLRGFVSFLVEVQKPAALAAKREIAIDVGIHRFAADGAIMLHGGNDPALDLNSLRLILG
jgi:transposase